MNNFKGIFAMLLVVLCMAGFSITAHASDGDEVTPAADGNTSQTTGTVATDGSRLNLRTGAGMSYEIIDQLCCGEEVTVIGSEGDWYKVIVPEKTGYVHGDYLRIHETDGQTDTSNAPQSSTTESDEQSNADGKDDENGSNGKGDGKSDNSFTPNGNMTLVDDFLQVEAEATENNPQMDKQFISLQSKNGNTFYLVVDRNGEQENVYFMNLVDEADLMALIESDKEGKDAPACSCIEKCSVGAIKTDCEVCRTNMSECVGKETVIETDPTESADESEEEKPAVNVLPVIILLLAGGGGGAFYWFKIRKPKPKTSGDSDLDDYDYGQDDEDFDEETEIDDADVMAESEDNEE